MNQQRSIRSIWVATLTLILILAAVACQPSVEMEEALLPPSAAPTAEADTPQPLPATQIPTAIRTTAPEVALPVAASAEPQPSPLTEGETPLLTVPLQMPHRDEIGLSPEAEKVIVLTQKDLAQRLSIAEEVILVQSIEPVTWPDASMGCPVPGQTYAQVLTPGFRILVEAGGQVYEYHTGVIEPIVLCREEDSAMEESLVPGTTEPAGAVAPGLESFVQNAREDLARRLSVETEQITVLEAKAVVWPDSSLGCPQPGMAYAEVLTPGFLILLGANDKEYEYHTSRGTEVVYCENPDPPIPGTPDDF